MLDKINIISVLYFLWFSAMAPVYGYLSVYAEHYANASSSQYGLLNMVMPFVSIWSKVFFCSLADRRQAYRSMFIWFLAIALLGYSSYALLPFFVQPPPKEDGLVVSTWIIFCTITAFSTIALSVIACLSDTFGINIARRRNTSFGRVRVWGTLGWGLSSLLLSIINQSKKLPLLVPGLIMTTAFMFADLLAAILWPYKEDFKLERPAICLDAVPDPSSDASSHQTNVPINSSDDRHGTDGVNGSTIHPLSSYEPVINALSIRIQWKLFKEVAKRRSSIYIYMGLFILSGAVISLQWSYFFLYLMNIYADDFAFISGFAMIIDAMLGELPFFLLSSYAISFLGQTQTLGLSFVSIGVRYLLYAYLLPGRSMYFVIVTEILQGPSFVLFYVVMIEIANEYSDCQEAITQVIDEGLVPNNPENVKKLQQGLKATMQSIVNSCYEGLGLGIGSIVGGVVSQYYGFENLWFYSALVSLLVGLATSVLAPRWTRSLAKSETRFLVR